jgi:hypothetical protein
LTGERNFGVRIATKTEVFINFINDFYRAIAISFVTADGLKLLHIEDYSLKVKHFTP